MRIALIAPGYADETDWAIPVLRDLVRGIAGHHEVLLFALRYPHRRGRDSVDGIPVRTFGGASASGFASARLLIRAITGVIADLRRRPPDLLHALWADEPGAVAVAGGRALRVPAIASVLGGEAVALPEIHYGGRLGLINRRLLAFTLRHAAHVTVPSPYVRRAIEPHVAPHRLTDLPLGIDGERFHAEVEADTGTLAGGRPGLLQVASLVPVKDQRTLLEAFARVRRHQPQAHLHLVGEGPLRRELERRAAEPDLAGHVTFHGRVPHERMPAYYRGADLYVQSSRHESQGMAVLEAAACALPVVGTAVGLLPELPGARAVPPGDAGALAAAIVDGLGRDATGRETLAAAAAGIRQRYGMRGTLERLETVYRAVATGAGPAATSRPRAPTP